MRTRLDENQVNIQWLPSVATYQDLLNFPQDKLRDGLVCMVRDTDKKYTYDAPTQSWVLPNINKDQLYNFDIPDIEEGDGGKILIVNDSEDGCTYIPQDTFVHSLLLDGIQEPIGFINSEGLSSTYDPVARTITLTGDLRCSFKSKYVEDFLLNEISSGVYQWVSPPHELNPPQNLYLKYDGTDFSWSYTSWEFSEVQIALVVVKSSTPIFAQRETHGLMQWQVHEYLHTHVGTIRISGGILNNYVGKSSAVLDRRPDISSCILLDEDLKTDLIAFNYSTEKYTLANLNSVGALTFNTDQNDIVPIIDSFPAYNTWDGNQWIQAQLPANASMSVWLIAIPTTSDNSSKKYRFVFLQGQEYSVLTNEELSKVSLDIKLGGLESLSPEFSFLAHIVLRRVSAGGGAWYIDEVKNLINSKTVSIGSLGNIVSGLTAYQVVYDNAFSQLVAVNVNGAIDELKLEIDNLKNRVSVLEGGS